MYLHYTCICPYDAKLNYEILTQVQHQLKCIVNSLFFSLTSLEVPMVSLFECAYVNNDD